MAYMSQEKKKELAPKIKAVLKKYGLKGSLGVRHHSSLVLKIKSGSIDFVGNYIETMKNRPGEITDLVVDQLLEDQYLSVNPYWYHEHFSGAAKDAIEELLFAMNEGNHDRSDIQTDYFDVGWWIDINIGQWDKPYILEN